MILIANSEAWPGFQTTVDRLRAGERGPDPLVAGIARVEREATVRSVGYGGWPNMLGEMEFDAGVMDGGTRQVGAVGALRDVIPASAVALQVMRRLPHTLLTGDGARRFALECGFDVEPTLLEDSRRVWWERLEKELPPADLAAFPNIPLAPLSRAITDPERVRDTTVFLGRDAGGDLHAATSTSGWAWKYPGRLGDSPVAGAGFYADSRFGAAACTHTGEMTVRCGTARAIVLALQLGKSLREAVDLAVADLAELREGFLAGVVIHALDAHGNHEVVSFRCGPAIRYWYWDPSLSAPEERVARTV
ncbi:MULTISPECIES: isoaspartyl peptidase/L-asparaginase [Nitrospirillum]|uniref:L-asparaginase n=1 Tax=Nitrospirillum amazonense TaxID=28077 RepID=A0A560FYY8_9PROT|nr:isoaspartyl peptidase/L-asparaginase [Nitrospirillum amazonense]MEC4592476.1 isoaspartyl peptidase/L-asparaginase [Nitrospirillum amazonense]TWB26847.1 L-asparaginase [Nitrospirillum amazonense]